MTTETAGPFGGLTVREDIPAPDPAAETVQTMREESGEIEALLATLPPAVRAELDAHDDFDALLEVVLDLGRRPCARYHDREVELGIVEVNTADLRAITSMIGPFGADNRAGIPRTLHRIACMRNRQGEVVGLTMRVGRAVAGSVAVIQDLVDAGESILLLGRPGVGKTTLLREVARVSAAAGKRVVIVDTSNEIAGDGDIPHAGIGRARRMQVAHPEQQHAVMVEAVENHMPEVIVIDEIGTELEAQAARTIAERGVQLVATAHGNALANLMLNPTLSDLIGGIQTVTLSDEEARRRGTRKSVRERKAPPTFTALVEIHSFTRVAVHEDVGSTVDALLRGRSVEAELRELDDGGEVHVRPGSTTAAPAEWRGGGVAETIFGAPAGGDPERAAERRRRRAAPASDAPHRRVFPLGLSESRLREAMRESGANVSIAERIEEADVLMTLRSSFRRRPPELRWAEQQRLPIVVLKHNTVAQMQQSLRALSRGATSGDVLTSALSEAEEAIAEIHAGAVQAIELAPQRAHIRRLQHELASRQALESSSRGREPNRRVRIHA